MTRDEFWVVVEGTRPKGVWAEAHSGFVEMYLERQHEAHIISFERHFRELMAESYRWDLWGAAYVVNGGCSDDGFEYFRAWLISQGRKFYEKCLANPEAVGARASRDGERTGDEAFLHCAAEAFQEKTGRPLPAVDVPRPAQPLGVPWEEKDLPRLYPKLTAKFGWWNIDAPA